MPMMTVHVRLDATTSACSILAMWTGIWFLSSMSSYVFLQVVAVPTGVPTIRASQSEVLPICPKP